ncbi:MAG: hypothetical protein JOY69_07075 [Candidatus Eremiobacteraeota bacterium]|nr:hypothetical protein [Candidatus Eremiobacteraeota bacterium]
MPKAIVTLLCGVGLYASLFMLAKTLRAQRGELLERSVVETPRARLFAGLPNALLGAAYYAALAGAVWTVATPAVAVIVLTAAACAALTSGFLAYSLLFVTRRPCGFCWTAHAINWCLSLLCSRIYYPEILSSTR